MNWELGIYSKHCMKRQWSGQKKESLKAKHQQFPTQFSQFLTHINQSINQSILNISPSTVPLRLSPLPTVPWRSRPWAGRAGTGGGPAALCNGIKDLGWDYKLQLPCNVSSSNYNLQTTSDETTASNRPGTKLESSLELLTSGCPTGGSSSVRCAWAGAPTAPSTASAPSCPKHLCYLYLSSLFINVICQWRIVIII